jgi:hypothetical protein
MACRVMMPNQASIWFIQLEPFGVKYLLGEAVGDADAVRDDVGGHAVDALGGSGRVLILNDTGELRKGASL